MPAPDRLSTSVQYVKGVGPSRAEKLRKLGVETVEELLFYLPRDYQDLSDLRPIAQLKSGKLQTVRGRVLDLDARPTHKGGMLAAALVEDGTGRLRAVWYNQPTAIKRLAVGDTVLFSGRPSWRMGCWEMAHPQVQLSEDGELNEPLLPVYPLTDELRLGELRRIMRDAVAEYAKEVPELLPESLRRSRGLQCITEALATVHFPPDRACAQQARARLAYQEFLLLELAIALRHRAIHQDPLAPVFDVSPVLDRRIRNLFEFELTADQNRTIEEICHDIASGRAMNRLLQGDVGCGKTAVAVYALLVAVAHQYQAAIMAPTEVLAQQHWQTMERYLQHSSVRRLLLTGSRSPRERGEMLSAIRSGQVDLLIGTQAVIQDDVEFAKLGLVVIDEQHKFGVWQRARFRHKGAHPHYLVMTATPIPRTLTMTVFGDLDVSLIHTQPPGRQKVRTYLVGPQEQTQALEFVARKVSEGRQAYCICPLVEESELLDLRSAEGMLSELSRGPLAGFRLGLIHGRMTEDEKHTAMQQFRSGKIQVLVSTLVVEVGVDVPNATVIVVVDAQRFGLSQLHQLRGRTARGKYPGFCFLLADKRNPESTARLQILVDTNDGFRIAEEDLRMRGPGEFLGTRQHGLTELRVGNLLGDFKLIRQAREDAFGIVRQDPELELPEHRVLFKAMMRRFGSLIELASVG